MIKNHIKLVQYLTLSLMIASFGVSFDAFWHLTKGRESFFVLPHLFVYGGSILSIYFSWLGHRYIKKSEWTWIFRILLLIPLSAPLDELWHILYGKEPVDSITILWSPPHALLFLSAMTVMILTARMVKQTDRLKNKNLLGCILAGLFLNLAVIFMGPFYPTSPINILGSSGLGIIALVALITMFYTRRWFNDYGSASLTIGTFLILQMLLFDSNFYISEDSNFFHMPDWNLILVYLVPAMIVDASDNWYTPSRGMIAGLLFGILFFGLGGLAPSSPFVYADLWSGTITSAIGGIFAGFIFEHLIQNHKKPA